jgi:hypothetical protein
MKRFVLVAISMFAFTGFSAISPITSFTAAQYEASGSTLDDAGNAGETTSFIEMDGNAWTIVQLRNDEMYFYEYAFTFDAYGFFTVVVSDVTDLDNPVNYNGNGNCGSAQCQMTVQLNNGVMQKNTVFNADGSVSCSGAIYYNDGTTNIQWEGQGSPIPEEDFTK